MHAPPPAEVNHDGEIVLAGRTVEQTSKLCFGFGVRSQPIECATLGVGIEGGARVGVL